MVNGSPLKRRERYVIRFLSLALRVDVLTHAVALPVLPEC